MRITWALVSLGLLYYCANAQDDSTTTKTVVLTTTLATTAPAVAAVVPTTVALTTLPPTTKPTTIVSDQATSKETTPAPVTVAGAPPVPPSPSQVPTKGSDSGVVATAGSTTAASAGVPNLATAAAAATLPAAIPTNAHSAAVPTVAKPTGGPTVPSTGGLTPAGATSAGGGGAPVAAGSTTVPPSHAINPGAGTTPSMAKNPNTSPADSSGAGATPQSVPAGATGTTPPIVTTTKSTSASVTEAAATTTTTTVAVTTTPTTMATTTTTEVPKPFSYTVAFSNGDTDHPKADITQLCKRLMRDMENGTCIVTGRDHNGKTEIESMQIQGYVGTRMARQYYEEMNTEKKPDRDNTTLIAILASCGALLAMIVGGAIYVSRHRKPDCENQHPLTEELQPVENGYHDNPTLEVNEVQPEMQEKKQALNGEFNDSWIVPIDNLLKEDIPDEEDTHL